MNIAMILAGGVGKRMDQDIPKQFVPVLGKPVIAYTLETFQAAPEIDAVQVVCIPSYREEMRQIVEDYRLTKVRWIVDAGDTYQKSVICGLHGLEGQCKDDDIVVIHFGVSPFVSEDEIHDSIRVCGEHGNAVAVTPCFLCLCQKDGTGFSDSGLDRDTIVGLNSPQTFRYDVLREMYQGAEEQGLLDTVEPHTTSLMFAMGIRLYFSKSSQRNIKLTTQEDLELFEGYALWKRQKEEGLL